MEIFRVFGTMALQGNEKIQKTIKDVGKSLTDVGGKITNVGAKLSVITAGFGALAIKGVMYNSTVQDLQTSFKVLLGSQEKAIKLTNELKKVGAETPFEITGLASASKTLLAFGVNQKDLIPTMTKIGDISLGNNEAFQSMARVMGQINALGKLQGGDLNQLINWGWNPLNEITEKTGETMEQVRKRMSAGKVTYEEVEGALNAATSAGGRFYKGMEEGSKTLSGKLSTLSDVFNELLGQATKPLFDFLADRAIPILTDLIEVVTDLDPEIQIVILAFAGLVAAAGPVLVLFGGAVTAFGLFLGAITAINLPIVIITGLIMGLIAAIGGIGGAIVAATIKSGKLGELEEAFNKVKDVVTPIPELIAAIFTNDKSKMMDLLINKFNLSWQEADSFANKVNELKEKIDKLAEKIGTKVKDKLAELATKIWENRHEIAEFILKIIDFGIELMDWIDENGPAIKEFTKDVVKDLSEVLGVVGSIVDGVKALIEQFKRYFYWSDKMKNEGSWLSIFGISGNSELSKPKLRENYAEGTNFATGGWSLVGEKGPELINLPRGSQVFTASETSQMLSQKSIPNSNVSNSKTTIIEKVIINAREIKELNDLIKMFSEENIILEMNSR